MRSAPPLPSAQRTDIRRLVNGLRERRDKSRADRVIGGQVREVFEGSDAPGVFGLHFYVFEGAVSVYGAVATYDERDRVVSALAAVAGITQIADHLSILS